MLVLYADGASRGNPGEASLGAVVVEDGVEIGRVSQRLGVRTNNYAEYSAVIAGLEYVLMHNLGPDVHVRMDSKLVVEQLSGRWQIKHPELRELARTAHSLIAQLNVSFEWIPREQNALADEAANQALDAIGQVGVPSTLSSVQPSSIRAPRVSIEPTTIYLVRHGKTASTESKLVSGSLDDPPLSSSGREHSALAARAIESLGSRHNLARPSLVVHSDLVRAAQTADIISDALSLPARPDSRLREISFGEWEARPMGEIEQSSEALVSAWRGSVTSAPPGGESIAAMEKRVRQAITDLVGEFQGGSAVVVAHMMPLRAIATIAMNLPSAGYWSLQFEPCSVSVLRFFGGELCEVFCLNSCEHLPRG